MFTASRCFWLAGTLALTPGTAIVPALADSALLTDVGIRSMDAVPVKDIPSTVASDSVLISSGAVDSSEGTSASFSGVSVSGVSASGAALSAAGAFASGASPEASSEGTSEVVSSVTLLSVPGSVVPESAVPPAGLKSVRSRVNVNSPALRSRPVSSLLTVILASVGSGVYVLVNTGTSVDPSYLTSATSSPAPLSVTVTTTFLVVVSYVTLGSSPGFSTIV